MIAASGIKRILMNSNEMTRNIKKSMIRDFRRMFSTPSQLLKTEERDGLRTITLNDKKTYNSLSMAMMKELQDEITREGLNLDLRCIAIKAEGPCFSSGHNLKEMTSDKGIDYQKEIFAKCTDLMLSIRRSQVPVISVVNGLAAAAGCQMVAACDFAIASESSTFSTPGAQFGLFCSTPGVSVSRKVNASFASYMTLTGLTINSEEALRSGLIVKVVPANKLDATLEEIYASIKHKSRSVISLGKEFFYRQLQMNYEDALREGGNKMVENLQYIDSQEGLNSFKEKRKPIWTHKPNTI